MTPYCKVLPKMFVLLFGSFFFLIINYSNTNRVLWLSVTGDFSKQKQDPEYEGRIIIQPAVHFTEMQN